MAGQHDRYERLAVAHVLGGLDEVAAADFRAHLLQCRQCRRQVAELQDLAADLAVAEREERAQLRLKTAVEDEEEDGEGSRPDTDLPWGFGRVASAALAGTVLIVLAALLVWNMDLHHRLRHATTTAEVREEVLAELAQGVAVPVEFGRGAHGVVVVDERDVTASVAGLPELRPGQVLVVWLETGGLEAVESYDNSGVVDGRVAFTHRAPTATRLLVTVEPGPTGDAPTGPRLLEATLQRASGDRSGAGSEDVPSE